PLFHQFFELLSLGGILPATDVVEGRVIGCDETAACAHLDTHVTDGHACLHGQAADGLAVVLNKIARGSARGYPGDDVQDDVFRYDALAQRTVDLDPHGFRTMLKDTLRGQHLLNFAGSYTKCDRAKGTVSRGAAVATYDRHAGQGQPKFRADNVYDALVRVAQAIQRTAELVAVLFQHLHLVAGDIFPDRKVLVQRGDVMVRRGGRPGGVEDFNASLTEPCERLRAGHLVNKMTVYV